VRRLLGSLLTGAIAGVAVGVDFMESSEMRKKLEEIESMKKDFVAYKEEILYLEYEKSGRISEGYLLIVKRNGERIRMRAVPRRSRAA